MNRIGIGVCGVSALGLLAGTALGASRAPVFDETVPAALASPEALAHRALSEAIYAGLPADQQALIAAAGGFGPTEADLPGEGVRRVSTPSTETPPTLDEIGLTDEVLAELDPFYADLLRSMTERVHAGEPVGMYCLAPDTDAKTAQAFLVWYEGLGETLRHQFATRWSRTAVSGLGLVQGQATTVTYSYVPDGTTTLNLFNNPVASNFQARMNQIYGNPATWQPLYDLVFGRWANLTGLDYVWEQNDDGVQIDGTSNNRGIVGVRGDVRISGANLDGNSGVLAFNFFPDAGDMVIDTADSFFNVTSQNSRRLRNVVSHEHGHGLGSAHVCPSNGTKLMEPFITTSFNGPQLDDIIFGHRAYGDINGVNNSAADATDLGQFGLSDSFSQVRLSIDDNTDVDYYRIETAQPSEVSVTLTPAAAAYNNGTQNPNGSCSSGVLTDYNSMHDLRFELRDSSDQLVQAVNNNGEGNTESGVVQLAAPGVYYIVVRGDNTNDVQMYEFDVLVSSTVIPLTLQQLAGPEGIVAPGPQPDVEVLLDENDDTVVINPQLLIDLDGVPSQVAMTLDQQIDPEQSRWSASLPDLPCGSVLSYEIQATGVVGGLIGEGPTETFGEATATVDTLASDDFETDQGWAVSGAIVNTFFGMWERAVPTATTSGAPPADADGSGTAWVTGNEDGLGSVFGGDTVLTSPVFNLSGSISPTISFSTWFDADDGSAPDLNILSIAISVDGGGLWIPIDTLGPGGPDAIGGWIQRSYRVKDFATPGAQTMVRIIASDAAGVALVEAGVDGFSITDVDCDGPDCPADLNGDGILDNGDIAAFLTLFLAGDLAVDFNGDGLLDNGDISAFLIAFLAGCD